MSKEFDKYQTIGPDYHYRQIDKRSFRNYNASLDARYQKLLGYVEKIAGDRKLKLLDVGSGDGVILYLLRKSLPDLELHGVDEVETALAVAREKVPNAKIVRASAYKLPYSDETFDIVTSSDVIEHLDKPETMLEEIKRVAKRGASIIVGTPIRRTKNPADPHHVDEFFPEDFLEMMSRYFKECTLSESHNLIPTLLYNAPTRSFINYRYLINFLSLFFNYNPFFAERRNKSEMFAYMHIICRK